VIESLRECRIDTSFDSCLSLTIADGTRLSTFVSRSSQEL
jgi:hypothetical protein